MRNLLPLVALIFFSGCASTYNHEVVSVPAGKLDRDKSVLVATPRNGFYGDIDYPASGRQTALVVQSAFARFSSKVEVNTRCADLQCLQSESQGYAYLVVPQILHWEDRATEWSGIPDKVEVKVTVVDAQTSRELASIVISGKSKWATFGGDHPQDLLPEPIKQYVASLY